MKEFSPKDFLKAASVVVGFGLATSGTALCINGAKNLDQGKDQALESHQRLESNPYYLTGERELTFGVGGALAGGLLIVAPFAYETFVEKNRKDQTS